MPMATEVFISYRHADRPFAERLYALLQERRVTAWYDALIPAGADWRDTIVAELTQARVMVILLSAAALQSDELKKELAVADQENVPLLAARLENVKPRAAFAYELARGNWFDLFDNPQTRLAELADLLTRLVRDASQIPRTLEASVQARAERRRRDAWGALAFLRRPSVLAGLVAIVSLVALWLYELRAAPIERLTAGGLQPLVAYAYVAIAVTVASPLIAMSLLRGGAQVSELPLLIVAVVNTGLVCSLIYASVREIRLKVGRILRR
jgi:TIR domain